MALLEAGRRRAGPMNFLGRERTAAKGRWDEGKPDSAHGCSIPQVPGVLTGARRKVSVIGAPVWRTMARDL